MIVASFGGGVNSTAMLIGMVERKEPVDLILFADTGGEKPHTYEHIADFTEWAAKHGLPPVIIVKGSQPQQLIDGTLEQECLRLGTLPSRVMGFWACSDKWKRDPFNRYVRRLQLTEKPTNLIGFDADEPHRAERAPKDDPLFVRRYPLIEWNWGREECLEAIARAGLKSPGKSACFYCPSSRKNEVLELKRQYPDLLARALEMERRAKAGEGQAPALRAAGLGRHWAWADLIDNAERQLGMFTDAGPPEVDCGCYDGTDA